MVLAGGEGKKKSRGTVSGRFGLIHRRPLAHLHNRLTVAFPGWPCEGKINLEHEPEWTFVIPSGAWRICHALRWYIFLVRCLHLQMLKGKLNLHGALKGESKISFSERDRSPRPVQWHCRNAGLTPEGADWGRRCWRTPGSCVTWGGEYLGGGSKGLGTYCLYLISAEPRG